MLQAKDMEQKTITYSHKEVQDVLDHDAGFSKNSRSQNPQKSRKMKFNIEKLKKNLLEFKDKAISTTLIVGLLSPVVAYGTYKLACKTAENEINDYVKSKPAIKEQVDDFNQSLDKLSISDANKVKALTFEIEALENSKGKDLSAVTEDMKKLTHDNRHLVIGNRTLPFMYGFNEQDIKDIKKGAGIEDSERSYGKFTDYITKNF